MMWAREQPAAKIQQVKNITIATTGTAMMKANN
jgi:hypothetical protein